MEITGHGDYILLKLSNLACNSLSIPPSSVVAVSACGTLLLAAGVATADDGALTSCVSN
jgi:hypothetical protein